MGLTIFDLFFALKIASISYRTFFFWTNSDAAGCNTRRILVTINVMYNHYKLHGRANETQNVARFKKFKFIKSS